MLYFSDDGSSKNGWTKKVQPQVSYPITSSIINSF